MFSTQICNDTLKLIVNSGNMRKKSIFKIFKVMKYLYVHNHM